MLIPDVQMNSTPTSNCSISATWKNAQKGTYFPRVSQRISRKFREENPNYQKEEIKPNETLLSRPYDAELFAMVAKALRLYGASTACADVAPMRVARTGPAVGMGVDIDFNLDLAVYTALKKEIPETLDASKRVGIANYIGITQKLITYDEIKDAYTASEINHVTFTRVAWLGTYIGFFLGLAFCHSRCRASEVVS